MVNRGLGHHRAGIWEQVRWNFGRNVASNGRVKISLIRKRRGLSLPDLVTSVEKTNLLLSCRFKSKPVFCGSTLTSAFRVLHGLLVFLNRCKRSVFDLELWAKQYQRSCQCQYFHSGPSGARLLLRASFPPPTSLLSLWSTNLKLYF